MSLHIIEEEQERLRDLSRTSSTNSRYSSVKIAGQSSTIVEQARKWKTKMPYIIEHTINPIRHLLEQIPIKPNPELDMIPLSIGDPSVFGNFPAPKEASQAVADAVLGEKANGYAPSMGTVESREAIAAYLEQFFHYKPKIGDISLANGASGAIEFAISTLAGAGQNILVPQPGFPLYEVLAKGQGIKVKYYDLLPDYDWDVDVQSLENAIDEDTAAVVFINPSNPCGAVFGRDHMERLVGLCDQYKLPIIADEIYAGMIFPGRSFSSFAEVSTRVPTIVCGGLAKRFLVPGWRLGWTIVHDPANVYRGALSKGINKLTTRLVGPNSVVQAAIPAILEQVPESWHKEQNRKLAHAAQQFYDGLSEAPGLNPIMPSGAMYMMVGIDLECFPDFTSDMEFVESLISQQSVFCLPGTCFGAADFIRVVITIPDSQIPEAVRRIVQFCRDNTVEQKRTTQFRRASAFLPGGSSH